VIRKQIFKFTDQNPNKSSSQKNPMSASSVKLIAFLALLVHGIGHLQGIVSSSGIKFRGSTSNTSWLLKGMGQRLNRLICLVLYLAASVFGIFAALCLRGVLGPDARWTSLALTCAIFSTLGLVLFPKAVALFFNKAGAIGVNLIIFYSILFNGNWPSAIFED
jgi:hypothetical protein